MISEKKQSFDVATLLRYFKQQDNQNKDSITAVQLAKIIRFKLNINQIQIQRNRNYSFDDLLSIISLYCNKQQPSFYIFLFIKMLMQFQKNYEKNQQYEQAQNIDRKINKIKQKQLHRRKIQLKDKQKKQIRKIQMLQEQQIKVFNTKWDKYLTDFQNNAFKQMDQIKNKHLQELEQSEKSLRIQITKNMKYSKRILELKHIQKGLAGIKNYGEAIKAREIVKQYQNQEDKTIKQSNQHIIQTKLASVRKVQQVALISFKNKIINQRMVLIQKRKQDYDSLLVRLKYFKDQAIKKMRQQQKNMQEIMKEQFNGTIFIWNQNKNKSIK